MVCIVRSADNVVVTTAALPLLLLFVLKRYFEAQRQHGQRPKRSGLSGEHFEMLAF